MLQKIKDNKFSIIVVTLILAAVAVAVYYVNFVYIPAQKAARMDAIAAERAAEEAAQKAAEAATLKSEADEGYDYSIIIQDALAQETERTEDNSFAPDSNVTVTTDPESGDVYIDREWGDTSGLNVTTPPAEEATENTSAGNMASGTLADIAGEDGTYHGEPDSESTPSTGDSQSGSTTETPSGSSSSSSSGSSGNRVFYDEFPENPVDGDICYVDGVKYEWDGFISEYFGWIPHGSGNEMIQVEGDGEIGDPCPNASWG